jgi:hypothetical protein
MAVGQVLWEDAELHGFVVEPLERFEQTCSTLSSLRNASTWGEVRAAELAPWAREFVEGLAVSREEDLERPVDDAERWSYEEVSESVVDRVPLSHDAASTQAWLGRDLLEAHARISGSSPGGHIDGYQVHDREAFLSALRDAGHDPVHRPGFLQELFEAV